MGRPEDGKLARQAYISIQTVCIPNPHFYLIISFCHKSSNENASPCLGITVPWLPGSVWTTYPYQRHAGSVGWTPIAFNKNQNKITIRSDHCEGSSRHLIDGACTACKALPDSSKYRDFVQYAAAAPAHMQWDYLTSDQLSALLSKSNNHCRQLRTQVINPLHDFVFNADQILVIQFKATHLYTWSEVR